MTATAPAVRFEDYVAHHQVALLRFATALIGDVHVAEDVVGDVLARVYEQWDRVAAADHPHAYVRRMVVNSFVSWRRKWARVVPVGDDSHVESPLPDTTAAHAERDALIAQLARLPRRQRAAVVLRFFEDLPDEEIASAMRCSVGTVRSHVSRALATLRIAMSEDQSRTEGTDHA